jgi:hypothetical protein|tara:strand:- start:669 stop:1874 length:1206 start_codon:yes stop_codon:yes gene_type:complete
MSKGENELFDGIQILSPQELEESQSGGETKSEDSISPEVSEETKGEEKEISISDGLTIAPPEETTSGEEIETTTTESKESVEIPKKGTTRYQALIKDLMKDDIFLGVDEEEIEGMLEDASAETVKKLMAKTLETQFQYQTESWMNNFSGAKKRFLEIEDKFSDTDHAIQMAQRLDYLDNVTENAIAEDTNLQKNIYFEYLLGKNFSDAEARSMVEEADGIDKLEEKAQKALPSLRQSASQIVARAEQQKKQQLEHYKNAQNQQFHNLMHTVDSKEEFINGLKLNKTVKDKIKTNMTVPVYKDENGREYTSLMYKQMKQPAEFQALMSYYDQLGLFDVNKEGKFTPNIDKIKKVAKTKAVSELDRVLASEEERGLGRQNSSQVSGKTSGILDMLERGYKKKK